MIRRLVFTVAALAALAGCAGPGGGGPFGERIYGAEYFTTYSPSQFSAFAAAGPLLEVRGTPPGGATAAELAPALRLPAFWPQTPFRPVTPETPPSAQRIVLIFGVPGMVNPIDVCAATGLGGETPDRVEVVAAFCRGSRAGSTAKLSVDRPLAIDDPAFSTAMTRLFHAIAPPYDPLDRLDRGRGRLRFLFL